MYVVVFTDSAISSLRTQLKRGNGRLGKQPMEIARLVNDEETTAYSKSKGKNTGYTCDIQVTSCQGKVDGVISRLN